MHAHRTRRMRAREAIPAARAGVVLYTLSTCPSCGYARRLLRRRGIPFEEVRGDFVPGFRRELLERTGEWTVPQVLVGDEPIGGADALAWLDRRGALTARLRGEEFPVAVVRRRLSPKRLPRFLLSAIGGGVCRIRGPATRVTTAEGRRTVTGVGV